MKIFYALLALTFLSVSVVAQSKKGEIKYGIKAGINFSSIALSGSGITKKAQDDLKNFASYYVGANVEIPVWSSFFLQPGLSLSAKGFDGTIPQKGTQAGFYYSAKVTGTRNIIYLELPINAVYKVNNFYFGAGGYTAYAISGKDNFSGTADVLGFTIPVERKQDLKFGNEKADDLKPWDFGINFLAGYQLGSGTNIGLNYGLGLLKADTDKSKELQASNRVLSILIGYSF